MIEQEIPPKPNAFVFGIPMATIYSICSKGNNVEIAINMAEIAIDTKVDPLPLPVSPVLSKNKQHRAEETPPKSNNIISLFEKCNDINQTVL